MSDTSLTIASFLSVVLRVRKPCVQTLQRWACTEDFPVQVAFTLDRNKSITVQVGKMRKGILREDRMCAPAGRRVECGVYIA